MAALSTRKIAQKIGYTSGTLYQHFDDIRSIVLAVNARTMQGLIDAMAGSGPSLPEDPAERVHAYADIYLAYVKAHRNAWDAMFAWRRSEGEAVPDWYARQIETLVELVGDCFAKDRSRTRCRHTSGGRTPRLGQCPQRLRAGEWRPPGTDHANATGAARPSPRHHPHRGVCFSGTPPQT